MFGVASVDVSTSPVQITGIVLAVAAMLTALTPMFMRFLSRGERAEREQQAEAKQSQVSWQSITTAIQTERDRLQARLDSADALCQRRIEEVERDWLDKSRRDSERIQELEKAVADKETEIAALRRALRGAV